MNWSHYLPSVGPLELATYQSAKLTHHRLGAGDYTIFTELPFREPIHHHLILQGSHGTGASPEGELPAEGDREHPWRQRAIKAAAYYRQGDHENAAKLGHLGNFPSREAAFAAMHGHNFKRERSQMMSENLS